MNPVSWRSVMGRDYNCRLNNSHLTCGHSDGAGITGELALGSHHNVRYVFGAANLYAGKKAVSTTQLSSTPAAINRPVS